MQRVKRGRDRRRQSREGQRRCAPGCPRLPPSSRSTARAPRPGASGRSSARRSDEPAASPRPPPTIPAFISYTSGTTGPAKGALHAHRVLIGHEPGVRLTHGDFPRPGRSRLDAGRLGLDRRALQHGAAGAALRRAAGRAPHGEVRPRARLRPDRPHGVRNCFIPPTALRMMRTVPRSPPLRHREAAQRSARGARASAPKHARLGAERAGAHHPRVLRPDRVQPRARQLPPGRTAPVRSRARHGPRLPRLGGRGAGARGHRTAAPAARPARSPSAAAMQRCSWDIGTSRRRLPPSSAATGC